MAFRLVTSAAIAAALCSGAALAADTPQRPPLFGDAALPSLGFANCRALGSRLIEIPGTSTCIRIGGGVTADVIVPGKKSTEFSNRAKLIFNTATATDHGSLRSSIVLAVRSRASSATDAEDPQDGPAGLSLSQAWISYYGLTVGRARSFFDAPQVTSFERPIASSQVSDLIGYALHVSPQLSGAISLEDHESRDSKTALGADAARPFSAPDLIARLGIDYGPWSLQGSGAMRFLRQAAPMPQSEIGFALQGSLRYAFGQAITPQDRFEGREPARGPEVSFTAAYSKGASSYVGFGKDVPDGGCAAARCGLSSGWSVASGLHLPIADEWSANLAASYGRIEPAPNADPYSEWRLAGNIVYQPSPALKIGMELALKGQSGISGGIKTQPSFQPRLRVQADF